MPRVSELLDPRKEGPAIEEGDIWTACRCGRLFRLDECWVEDVDAEQTVYYCPSRKRGGCSAAVLTLSLVSDTPLAELSWSFRGWIIRNPFEVIILTRRRNSWSSVPANRHAVEGGPTVGSSGLVPVQAPEGFDAARPEPARGDGESG
jgi:hypothetical protein